MPLYIYLIFVILGLLFSLFGEKIYFLLWLIPGAIITLFMFFVESLGLGLGGGSHNDSQTVLLSILFFWICYFIGFIIAGIIRKRFSKKFQIAGIIYIVAVILYVALSVNSYIVLVRYDSAQTKYIPAGYQQINCSANSISPIPLTFNTSDISLKMDVFDGNQIIFEKPMDQDLASFKKERNNERFVGFGVASCKIWVIQPLSITEYIKLSEKFLNFEEMKKHQLYFQFFYNWKGRVYQSQKYEIEPLDAKLFSFYKDLVDKEWQITSVNDFNFWFPKDMTDKYHACASWCIELDDVSNVSHLVLETSNYVEDRQNSSVYFSKISGKFGGNIEIGYNGIPSEKYVRYDSSGKIEGEDFVFRLGEQWYHISSGSSFDPNFEKIISSIKSK